MCVCVCVCVLKMFNFKYVKFFLSLFTHVVDGSGCRCCLLGARVQGCYGGDGGSGYGSYSSGSSGSSSDLYVRYINISFLRFYKYNYKSNNKVKKEFPSTFNTQV